MAEVRPDRYLDNYFKDGVYRSGDTGPSFV